VAREAFRGLPGNVPRDDATFVQMAAGPFGTSSAQITARELNTRAGAVVPTLDLGDIDVAWLDREWLRSAVYSRGAVVAGRFVGEVGGRGIVRFEADQVFVPVATRQATCGTQAPPPCPRGTVPTFDRDADLCLVRTACVRAGACADARPECSPGYDLRSWRAGTRGCLSYACDPAFLTE
jgi:hypothetical protein